jgi:hypothetical protein
MSDRKNPLNFITLCNYSVSCKIGNLYYIIVVVFTFISLFLRFEAEISIVFCTFMDKIVGERGEKILLKKPGRNSIPSFQFYRRGHLSEDQ